MALRLCAAFVSGETERLSEAHQRAQAAKRKELANERRAWKSEEDGLSQRIAALRAELAVLEPAEARARAELVALSGRDGEGNKIGYSLAPDAAVKEMRRDLVTISAAFNAWAMWNGGEEEE